MTSAVTALLRTRGPQTVSELCAALGCSRKTVYRALADLVRRKAVQVYVEARGAKRYRIS